MLSRVLGTDEGARRLGEVALVPHSSPISASGLLFFNTLFDENAASHIALGQAYRNCLEGGTTGRRGRAGPRGANTSLIHIDWMIGSGADGRGRRACRRRGRAGDAGRGVVLNGGLRNVSSPMALRRRMQDESLF